MTTPMPRRALAGDNGYLRPVRCFLPIIPNGVEDILIG